MTSDSSSRPHRPSRSSQSRSGGGEEPAGFLPELLRRGLTLGFTGLFMTEEAVRRALGDSVPKDTLQFLLEQSDRMRADFLDRLAKEFGRVLSSMDPIEIAHRLLDGRTIEVTTRFRVIREEEGKPRKERKR
jgi:hypothetical protein